MIAKNIGGNNLIITKVYQRSLTVRLRTNLDRNRNRTATEQEQKL
jgi:hypothetical protein